MVQAVPRFRQIAAVLACLTPCAPTHAGAQEEPVFPLEGLVVTASPTPLEEARVPVHVTVLDGDELRARGIVTVADALREVTGAHVVRSGSYGAVTSLFLRGAESDHVLVLVDGVQVNRPGGSFDFAGLTLDNVERIEVVRGPASALYGSDAVAGVVHVITRRGGGAPRLDVRVRAGAYSRRDVAVDLAGGGARSGYALSVARTSTDGILAFNNQHRNTTLSAAGRFAPDARTLAEVTFRAGDRAYHFPTDGAGNVVDRNAFTFGDGVALGLHLARAVTSRLRLSARLGVTDTDTGSDDQPDDPADTLGFFGFNSLDHIRRTSLDLRSHLDIAGAVLTGGVEWEAQRQRSFNESMSQFGASSGRSVFSRENRAAYLHISRSAARVAVNGGLRVEDNERFGSFTTWSLGATWFADSHGNVRLRGAAGRALKEPTFFENFASGFARGNPDLKPERSTSWELGADATLAGGDGELSVTWFHQSLRDLIQYTFTPPVEGGPNFFNVAEADASGLEVEASLELGPARAGVGWTWLDTEVKDSGFDEGPGAAFVQGEPLLRRPAHTVSLNLSYAPTPALSLFADARIVGTRSDRDFSTFPATPVTLEAVHDVAVGARWELMRAGSGGAGLTLDARVENLLDENYQEAFGFPAPGRALVVGGTVTLGGR